MSLLTNVHAENKSERRLSVFIFNLIIFIMSCFILVIYATQPFFRVSASANLSKESLSELIVLENDEINLDEVLPESIDLSLTISIEADVALNTAAKVLNQFIFNFNTNADLTEEITALIDDNVTSLVNQIVPELEVIVLTTAKHVAVHNSKDALVSALQEKHGDTTTDFEQKLDAAGITDEYIEGKMDDVIDAFQAEDATLDSVAEAVVDVVDSIVAQLNNQTDTTLHLDSFDEEELKNEIKTALNGFADEETGKIDVDAALAKLFNDAINMATKEETPQAAKINGGNSAVLVSETINENVETEETVDLTETIRSAIMNSLGDDIYAKVGSFLKIVSLLLILAMGSWLYLMIKIIVKLFMKNNTVKFKAPIIFGALPGLLWLIPSVASHFVSKNPATVANPYGLTLSIFASGWTAVLGVLVLIVIAAPYSALRKGLVGKKIKKFK